MNTNGHEYPWTCLAAARSRDECRERLLPSFLLRKEALPLPMGQSRSASCALVDSSFFRLFQTSRAVRGLRDLNPVP